MKSMKIIKRSGQEVPFDLTKIENAIRKACIAIDAAKIDENLNEPRDERFCKAARALVAHNIELCDQAREVSPFYQGNCACDVPVRERRIETLLNPKRNGAANLLEEFGEACKLYRRGEYPHEPLHILTNSILSLIEDVLEPIYRHQALNVSATVVSDFYNYLITPNTCTSDADHVRKIDEFITRLQKRFCQNADAFYNRTSSLLERYRPKPRRSTRKGSGRHGTLSRTQDQQLSEFKTFLLDHPVSEIGQGRTLNARARQFWANRSKEFGKKARYTGENKGYASAKSLASAYRTRR